MRKSIAAAASIFLLMFFSAPLHAAELRVLAGGAMTSVWGQIKSRFELTSGHKLDIFFGTTPNLIKKATAGKPFDLGVVPVDVMQDAAARGRFAAGPTVDIARVGLGVAVRAGAAKPNISTTETFRQTLLSASSVASIPESATGYSISRAFERLGITEAMKAKMKAQPNPAQVVAVVARGEAELGLFLVNVLTAPGLEVVTLPGRGAARGCLHRGGRGGDQGGGGRPGSHRLPENHRDRSADPGQRNEPGLMRARRLSRA